MKLKFNKIKPMNMKLAFVVLALLIGMAGLSVFNKSVDGFILPTLVLVGGLFLLSEIGLKRYTTISNLKKFDTKDIIMSLIGFGTILYGLVLMPLVPIEITWLSGVAGFLLIATAISMLVQTQM